MRLRATNLLAAALALCPAGIMAAFQTSFANVTQGAALRLVWDAVDAKYYPLAISARLINRTADNKASGAQMNLTTHLSSGTSYIWESVPYPLPYAPTGDYVVEIRPSVWNPSAEPDTLNVPVVVKSTFFRINEDEERPGGTVVTGHDNVGGGVNKTLALGVGVSIGVTSVIAFTIIGHVLRKRHKRVLQEKRRRRRFEFVID